MSQTVILKSGDTCQGLRVVDVEGNTKDLSKPGTLIRVQSDRSAGLCKRYGLVQVEQETVPAPIKARPKAKPKSVAEKEITEGEDN